MGGGCSLPQDKHIVIIGGGFGGKELGLILLTKQANFTIIDTKDALHVNVASVRAVVEPGFARKVVIPYEPTFGKHFQRGKVTHINIDEHSVLLEDGRVIKYDVLIIATGSCGPMKEWLGSGHDIVNKYTAFANQVRDSGRIVIIGGGPVGIEVAGEIATNYPDKQVTIISNNPQLIMKDPPANLTKRLNVLLDELHVKTILGECVTNDSELADILKGSYSVKTNKDTVIETDLVIKCTGLQVNSSAYTSSLGGHMETNGALKVNEYFEVEGQDDIYAIGDCINIKEIKLAFIAQYHAQLLLQNLAKKFNKHPMKPWNTDSNKFLMVLSVGRHHAIGCTKSGFMLPEFFLKSLKCNDLMVGRFYKVMHQTEPK